MLQTISLRVSGQVQGVFFRHSAREKARELNITGTVQNNPDGSVTIVASGSGEQLDKLIAWSKTGPRSARVEQVTVQVVALQSFNSFSILR